ncbi:MAG: serine hydrolase [Fodinibius sp.]|nr:serine hydrolase [Fodinibius sp.]
MNNISIISILKRIGMKQLAQLTAALLVLLMASLSVANAQPAALDSVEENISQRITDGPMVGVAVGYIHPDGEVSYLTKGNLTSTGSQNVTPESVFKIASVTKVFTALALAKLIDERSITLESKAESLLGPEFSLPTYEGKEITLQHLVSHTSGLPRLPGNLQMKDPQNPYTHYSKSKLQRFLADYKLTRAPGSSFQYSNLGMAIVGHILEEQYDLNYGEVIKKTITDPLNMSYTGIDLATVDSTVRTHGHHQGDPVPYWNFPAVEAMGGLHSSIVDLTRFVNAHLRVNSPIADIASTVKQPIFDVQHSGKRIDKVGMGWLLTTQQDSIWWHNGGTGGYSSFVGFNAETGAGVAVLGNARSSVDDIGLHLLDQDHRLKKVVSADELKKFVGQYTSDNGATYHISRQKSQLYVQRPGQPKFPIYFKKGSRFYLEAVNAEIEFSLQEGEVQQLTLFQNGQQYRAEKQN